MARIDLLASDDFKLFLDDISRRREKLYESLDTLLSHHDYSAEWTDKIFETRAAIRELNVVLGIPEEYRRMASKKLRDAGDNEGAEAQSDMSTRIRNSNWKNRLESLMKVFGGSSQE